MLPERMSTKPKLLSLYLDKTLSKMLPERGTTETELLSPYLGKTMGENATKKAHWNKTVTSIPR